MSRRGWAILVGAVGFVLSALLGTGIGISNAGRSTGSERAIEVTDHWGSIGPFGSHFSVR
ncbi:hypothetical protein [Actinocrispum wychmicini]|uniref:Uncharacterized protein n=1 Tax=Actinocrispum wychmicini TaxID=1213861 RepID=A0A4R2J763_9PSEU|nr:hypothetical protein [Actinocrispum wychmicini]TCO53442.1 hypothetical protein EV192_11031 [Actinocrispum wychmicini]